MATKKWYLDRIDEIFDFLEKKWGSTNCPICGSWMKGHFTKDLLEDYYDFYSITGLIPLICSHCGYTIFICPCAILDK